MSPDVLQKSKNSANTAKPANYIIRKYNHYIFHKNMFVYLFLTKRYNSKNLENEILKGGSLAKSRKLFFQGRSFLEGKIQKMQKKISKNFIVPNRLLGHTDHLYTYKGHIEHVGFT